MPRTNSSNWSTNAQITAVRLQDFNEDVDDIYTRGSDRLRVYSAVSGTALRIDIGAGAYRVGSIHGTYAGGTDIVVTNTATNYVEIDNTGTVSVNTSSWDATGAKARLGVVVCSGGVVTSITLWKPDVIGGVLGAGAAFVLTPIDGKPATIFPCATVAQVNNEGTIAYDAVSTYTSGAPATSHTISHTCTGSNRLLLVGFYKSNTADDVTGITYAGVAMTRVQTSSFSASRAYLYAIMAPATGANNIVISISASRSIEAVNTSYTGCNQDYTPDATTSATASAATSISVNTTTVNNNCWTAGYARNESANFSGYTGTARGGARNNNMIDSNSAKTPAGAVALGGTWAGSADAVIVTCSFAPVEQAPDVLTFDFDATRREFAVFQRVLPTGYGGGTVTAKFHWTTATGSGDVIWGIRARAFADGDDIAQAWGTAQEVTDTRQGDKKVQITSATSALTIAGSPAAGQPVVFEVYRKADSASDTLTTDARLLAIDITVS